MASLQVLTALQFESVGMFLWSLCYDEAVFKTSVETVQRTG
jgi:hypothetical protein